MRTPTPEVAEMTLRLHQGGQERCIAVGSAAWFAWLETARTFRFNADGAAFSARKQRQGKYVYWYAYARRDNHLGCVYLGKSVDLHGDRLQEALCRLHPLPDVAVPPLVAARFGRRSAIVRQASHYLSAVARRIASAREQTLESAELQRMLRDVRIESLVSGVDHEMHYAAMLDVVLTWAASVEQQCTEQSEALAIARRLLQEAQHHQARLSNVSMPSPGELH